MPPLVEPLEEPPEPEVCPLTLTPANSPNNKEEPNLELEPEPELVPTLMM